MKTIARICLYKKDGEHFKRSNINMPLGLEYQLISGLREVIFFDAIPSQEVEVLISKAKKMKLIAKALPVKLQYDAAEDKCIPASSGLAMIPVVIARDERTGNHAISVFGRLMAGGLAPASKRELMAEAGRILGYPECCIQNFVNMPDEMHGNTAALFHSHRNSKTVPNLLLVSHFRLIEHLPCNYGCEASVLLAKQTLSVLRDQGRTCAPFVNFVDGINKLALLTWSPWKSIGFINPVQSKKTTQYKAFYIFDGPAKESYKEIQKVVRLTRHSEGFFINNGKTTFYRKNGPQHETVGYISPDFHPSVPEILLCYRI